MLILHPLFTTERPSGIPWLHPFRTLRKSRATPTKKKKKLLHMPIDKYEMHTTSRTAQRTGELNLLEAATEASFCVALQGSSAVL